MQSEASIRFKNGTGCRLKLIGKAKVILVLHLVSMNLLMGHQAILKIPPPPSKGRTTSLDNLGAQDAK